MSEPIKQFNWQSDHLPKQGFEFYEFQDLLTRHLGAKGISFCLSETDTTFYRPVPPPNGASDRQRLLQGFQQDLRKFYGNFDTALGILRSSFVYNTFAYSLIEKACIRPQDILEIDWTPDKRFKAAYEKICKTFAPQDSSDVNQLRRSIQEITDVKLGGFDNYVSEFNRLHLALTKAQAAPTEAEAREWVMKGLENMIVKSFIISNILLPKPQTTFTEIFEETRKYLKYMNLGDNDPYKSIAASPASKPIVTAMITNRAVTPIRCTRCWRPNHQWKQCTAKACGVCNHPFNGAKYCINYQSHEELATRWAPPHLLKDVSKHNDPISAVVTPDDSIKKAKRALSSAIKNLKELKAMKRVKTGP